MNTAYIILGVGATALAIYAGWRYFGASPPTQDDPSQQSTPVQTTPKTKPPPPSSTNNISTGNLTNDLMDLLQWEREHPSATEAEKQARFKQGVKHDLYI